MHDVPGSVHWHEPTGGKRAGFGKFGRPKTPYDIFMESEGIPVFRDIGVSKVQNLPLAPWKRTGGRGSYIQLHGTEGKWGCYVVEVPGAGALNAEKHIYEEIYFVVEGRGTTEVWLEGDNKRHVFEWQKGSLFSIPVNAMHRIVNASSSPALLLAGTTAPNVMNLVNNVGAVFDNPLPVPRPLLRRRRFLQVQGRHRARSGARPRHAAHQLRARHRQLRPAARQPPLARLPPRRAVHDRQHLLSVDRPARERPLLQGARAHLGGGADLHQGQGLHLHLAGARRRQPVERRQGRQDQARRLRAGRHGVGGARRRALVPSAFRRLEGAAAADRLVRPAQSRPRARPARRAAHRLHRDGHSRGRQRHPLLDGRPVHQEGIRRAARSAKASRTACGRNTTTRTTRANCRGSKRRREAKPRTHKFCKAIIRCSAHSG